MRFLLLIGCILLSCHLPRQINLCQLQGKVIKTEPLDGCQWLIKTKDGRKLLAQNGSDFHLAAGEAIRFNYIAFDGMSTCMAEDEIMILTCLERVNSPTCPNDPDWQEISWIRNLVGDNAIQRIERYSFKKAYLYKVSRTDAEIVWYDCLGRKICSGNTGCNLPDKQLQNAVTIFLAHR